MVTGKKGVQRTDELSELQCFPSTLRIKESGYFYSGAKIAITFTLSEHGIICRVPTFAR